MEGPSIRGQGGQNVQQSFHIQGQYNGDSKQRITQHAAQLRLGEILDDDKIKSLTDLIGLSLNFESGEWHGIVCESGVIETLSAVMNETSNAKIRTLCSTVIHIIEQRGSENGQSTDWETILSPLISLLFNKDEKISEISKQSLLRSIGANSEISQALIELGLFDKCSETLELTFPSSSSSSQTSYSSSSSSSSSQTSDIVPQMIILNIVEVVDKVLKSNEESIKKTKQLKNCCSRIIKMKLPRPIKLAIQQIQIVMEGESTENDEESNQIKLHQAHEHNRLLEEQIHQKDELIRIIEQRLRDEQELKRQEQEQKISALDQVRAKETEIQHLRTEITQLRNISIQNPQIPLVIDQTQEDKTSELSNPDTTGEYIRLSRVDGLNRKAIALQDKQCVVIPLNKEMTKGIHSVSAKFEKCNLSGFANVYVGIAKASHPIPCPCDPLDEQNNKSMLYYFGYSGKVCFKGNGIVGNSRFSDGRLITMELNADVGTLHFIVDGIQQPVFVRGIKEAVKFMWEVFNKDSSVTIVSVKELNAPTVKKLENEKAIEWRRK
ncbi:MAG: hypothetical protein EZS28_022837 [Streblomastix strix]|uniref:SPRY domain-containing protein n=1 Tax=Streblomastix strix TaxID=222440 RepID=A0A5J4VH27_9EUKA|nr:MAG: hypothetical protein EZS28_022837 [Streblomastix strix]